MFANSQTSKCRILLTGATGFVGPWLLQAFKLGPFKDAEVFVWKYDPDSEQEKSLLNVDIRSREAVSNSIATIRPTHIVHMAAQSHIPTSFSNPELTWQINVMGTLHLLEAAREHVPDVGLLFISTSEVYGRSFLIGNPVDESCLLQPQNPYAASKSAADLMAGQFAAQGMHIVRLRPFNHFGLGQGEEFVAPSFAAQVARIEAGIQPPVIKVGNLQAQRDFLDVQDVVNAYVLALEKVFELPAGQAINICSGIAHKIEDLLTGFIARASCPIEIVVDSKRLRPSDTPLAVGNSGIARQYLGWQAKIPFDVTIGSLLEHWRDKVSYRSVPIRQ